MKITHLGASTIIVQHKNKKIMFKLLKCGLIIISMLSCKFDNPKKEVEEKNIKEIRANSFKADYDFLLKYIEIILLE